MILNLEVICDHFDCRKTIIGNIIVNYEKNWDNVLIFKLNKIFNEMLNKADSNKLFDKFIKAGWKVDQKEHKFYCSEHKVNYE